MSLQEWPVLRHKAFDVLTATRLFHVALALLLWSIFSLPATAVSSQVTLLTIDGAISPANADYVVRGITHAASNGSHLVIIQMDTPGGLDTSMRSIIKAILASPVPVAGYVAPSGARAASAGTYILYASHIAAMAPGTNLGAATPVQIGGTPGPEREKPSTLPNNHASGKKADDPEATDKALTAPMSRKQVNDAAAYIRGLAQMRNRNADWAERAVREAVSLSAEEASAQNVIDYVAKDIADLTAQLDGKKVNILGQDKLLQTRNANVVDMQPDWRTKLLATVTDPSVALILMAIGIYGIIFEFMNPGVGVPGVIGAICLLLGLYALQLLPVNYAGLALILLGMAFMAAEAFLPSFGILGLGGIVAFVAGALMLIDTDLPGYGIPMALIVTVAVTSALFLVAITNMALKARRRAVVGGSGNLIGSVAEIMEATQTEGWAQLQGENWHVVSHSNLRKGQHVRVVARKGLELEVAPLDTNEQGEQS
ncbi:MAG: nodulation protein NfeD [Burkholderiales bacterium]|nr:nodulation protein NfeD [Burkholderiales bacterium]